MYLTKHAYLTKQGRLGRLICALALLAGAMTGQVAWAQQAPANQAPANQAPANQAPANQALPETAAPPAAQTPAPAARQAPARRNQPAQIGLPAPTPIAEIPRGKTVLLAGTLMSPQQRTFVLNDGNSSIVIQLGPSWRDLTRLSPGARVRVLGQMDPYGTPTFRAGSIILDDGRVIVVPN